MNKSEVKKENIIFFFSDQQRYDTLGCNGQILPITPNIDQLASEGINYQSTYTVQPVCGPARSCLQTGLYPTQTGCFKNAVSLPISSNTIAKEMRKAGYQVAYVGKWHLASDEEEHHYEKTAVPVERRGGYEDFWRASDVLEFTSHGYDGYVFDEHNNKIEFKGYRADCITDFALEYVEQSDEEQPFFLFLSHIEPHHQNDRGDYEGPDGSKEKYASFIKPEDLEYGVGDWEKFMPDYLGCCNSLDQNLGRLVEALKKKGIYDNTTIIYASDHGCHFRTHSDEVAHPQGYDDYKRNSFENTIHIPLVIKGKHFQGGQTESKLISLIDLPKTILEIGGANIPEEMQGQSLLRINREEWKKYVYIQISESYVGRAVRTDRYKYVVWDPDKNPYECSESDIYQEKYLFDLQNDPWEKVNLVDNPEYKGVKKQLKEMLMEGARTACESSMQIKGGNPC